MPKHTDETYYLHAGSLPFVKQISHRARLNVYRAFCEEMQPSPGDTILDVGVSSELSLEANVLEQEYPYRNNIVCASTSDGATILGAYPGVRHVQIQPGQPLPFGDREFAISHSNAVIEHVGNAEQQRAFIAELARVARRTFIVTPNRLFPAELHTGLPLLHYLPKGMFRRLLRGTKLDYWSHEEHLNLLFPWELQRLVPPHTQWGIRTLGIGIAPWRSNIALFRITG